MSTFTCREASSSFMNLTNASTPAGRGAAMQKPRTGKAVIYFCCAIRVVIMQTQHSSMKNFSGANRVIVKWVKAY
jgi:hypothetical protein